MSKHFLVFCLALGSVPLRAAFQWEHEGVRSASLGGTVAASPQGTPDFFANPASIASLSAPEVSLAYARPFAGLDGVDLGVGSFALAVPLKRGVLGMGLGAFQAAQAKEETTLGAAYALSISPRLQAGVAVRRLEQRFLIGGDGDALGDPIFKDGTSRHGMAVDAGVTGSLGANLSFGVSARNLNEPDLGIAQEDRVRREVRAGLALRLEGLGLRATGDLSYGAKLFEGEKGMRPMFGLEKLFQRDRLALRLGGNERELTGGFGLRLGKRTTLDYGMAFSRELSEDNGGTHRAQMTYRFESKRRAVR